MPERQQAYFEFFGQLVEKLKSSPLAGKSVASNGRNWLPITQIPPCTVVFSFTSGRKSRVELYIDTGNRDKNKALFDALYGQRESIEEALRVPVTWERLDDARASRIACYQDVFITDGPEQLAELQAWAVELLPRFAQLMKDRLTSKVQSIS